MTPPTPKLQILKIMVKGYKINTRALNRWTEPNGVVALQMPFRFWLRNIEVPWKIFIALRKDKLIKLSGRDRLEPKYEITSEGLKLVKNKKGK